MRIIVLLALYHAMRIFSAPDIVSLTKPQRPRRVGAPPPTCSLVVELELAMAYNVGEACRYALLHARAPLGLT